MTKTKIKIIMNKTSMSETGGILSCNETIKGPELGKLISDAIQTKMHLRMEFDSDIGPTCLTLTR